MRPIFTGVIAPAPTPFEADGALDLFAFPKICGRIVRAGGTVAVCGGIGEGRTLSQRERSSLILEAVSVCRGRVVVVIDACEGQRALETAKEAAALGAAGLVVEAGRSAQAAGFFSFLREAAKTRLPLCVMRPGGANTLQLYAELSSLAGVEAIAERGREPYEALALGEMLLSRRVDAGLPYFVCACGETLPFARFYGARGYYSAEAALFPRQIAALFSASEDRAAATVALSDMRALLSAPDAPAYLKEALHREGWCLPTVRLPLAELDAAAKERLCRALKRAERAFTALAGL